MALEEKNDENMSANLINSYSLWSQKLTQLVMLSSLIGKYTALVTICTQMM